MIPKTVKGLSPFDCVSALQKYIRRGMEVEAMEVAIEMGATEKAYATWVCNRLQVISHEDVGLAAPEVIPLVESCCRQAGQFWKKENLGNWQLIVGTAIRALCRAPKSREGDHFAAVVALHRDLEGRVLEVPDWVKDNHTEYGKRKGRGVAYFQEVSAMLVPAPIAKDPYEDEAYRLWFQGEADKAKGRTEQNLFL